MISAQGYRSCRIWDCLGGVEYETWITLSLKDLGVLIKISENSMWSQQLLTVSEIAERSEHHVEGV